MTITTFDTLRVGHHIIARIGTDDGDIGFGEAHPATGTAGDPLAVLGALDQARHLIIGRKAEQIESIWQHLFRAQLFRGGSDAMAALSAIDVALWDIAARRQGEPVHALLGGSVRERVRLYVHVRGDAPSQLAEHAAQAVGDGFTAVRIYPFGPFDRNLPGTTAGIAALAARNVEAVRDAVGPEIDIIIDAVCRLTPAEALQVAQAIAPATPLYFEDPIEADDPTATVRFAARSPVPVGAGERLLTIFDFQQLLAEGNIGYIRPDPSLVGGFTGMRKIAALAEAAYATVVPHNPLSPVLSAACVAFATATQVATMVEYVGPCPEEHRSQFPGLIEPIAGYMPLPEGPGLGVEVRPSTGQPETYNRPPLMNADGSLRDY